MEVGIYLDHPDAKMPTLAYKGDVGYDLYALEDIEIPFGTFVEVSTGVHLQLPPDMFARLAARSSFGKNGLMIHAGVIDSGFTGTLTIWVYNIGASTVSVPRIDSLGERYSTIEKEDDPGSYFIKKGDKIAQILFHKTERPELKQIKRLKKTERGDKGHGSSGK